MDNFLLPDENELYITGDEGISVFVKKSAAMGGNVCSMGIISRWTGSKVRFINSVSDSDITVFAIALADTKTMYRLELAVKAALPSIG